MKDEILKRISVLLNDQNVSGNEAFFGALSLMGAVYGANSPQVRDLSMKSESLSQRFHGAGLDCYLGEIAKGALVNLKAEIQANLISSLQKSVTAEVLTDFLKLARAAIEEGGDASKNVGAVLAAALYEDTLRRLATLNGIPHIDKLQDVLTTLKDSGVLQGTQVGIANSYLNFRNSALHAQWERVEKESVASVLAFVEQLLLKHFS